MNNEADVVGSNGCIEDGGDRACGSIDAQPLPFNARIGSYDMRCGGGEHCPAGLQQRSFYEVCGWGGTCIK